MLADVLCAGHPLSTSLTRRRVVRPSTLLPSLHSSLNLVVPEAVVVLPWGNSLERNRNNDKCWRRRQKKLHYVICLTGWDGWALRSHSSQRMHLRQPMLRVEPRVKSGNKIYRGLLKLLGPMSWETRWRIVGILFLKLFCSSIQILFRNTSPYSAHFGTSSIFLISCLCFLCVCYTPFLLF